MVDNGTQFVAASINIGDQITIPVGANGSMLVPYRRYAGSFPTLSATRVLRRPPPPDDWDTVLYAAGSNMLIPYRQ